MNKIRINDDSTIYVICPAYIKTGGSELLHQLVKELNENGFKAYITYYHTNDDNTKYTDDDFKKYVDTFKLISEIEDLPGNVVVAYEDTKVIKYSKTIKKARVALWWLSVDNFVNLYGFRNALKVHSLRQVINMEIGGSIYHDFSYIRKIRHHLCQSHYAMDYLKGKGIEDVYFLSDYISDEYLNIPEDWGEKEDIIVYNPTKGFEFTRQIIDNAPDLNFIPIRDMTTSQVRDLMLKSKIYIDFGYHPGKDRLPRESAMCGCCIITSKKGSAKYHEDVPIDDEFKFQDSEENIDLIVEKIRKCLTDYDEEIMKFKAYREFIRNEKANFKQDVKEIFSR